MPKVKLLSYTPNPEKTVAAAAKLCYSPSDIDTLMGGLTPEKTESFVEMLSEIGHESPIEHASFTFGIEGVSRSFLAQITRHRIASYSVQSQRYVKAVSYTHLDVYKRQALYGCVNEPFLHPLQFCPQIWLPLKESAAHRFVFLLRFHTS